MTVQNHAAPDSLHSSRHLPALDGLRGIAILLVVVHHSTRYGGMESLSALDQLFQKVGTAGWSGVDLFFVLSGFLITGILLDAKGTNGYFRSFYARRILRIFPLYYGVLFCVFVLLPAVATWSREVPSLVKDQIWYWTYLQNVSVALKGWPALTAIQHFWSLAIEEQFYLVWPLVVLLLNRRAMILACLGLVVGSLAVRTVLVLTGHTLAAYVLTPSRMDGLALGGLLALIARAPDGLSHLARWAKPVVLSSALGLGAIVLWRHNLHYWDAVVETVGFSLLALFFGGVLAITVASPSGTLAARIFAHRFLRFVGRYSYAMYVFHLPILFAVARVFNVASIPRLAGSQVPGQLLFTSAVAAISLAAAWFSWHLYEARFLKLKARFPYDTVARPG